MITPETPGVRIPSAMTAQVPQITVKNKIRFRKLLLSKTFLNFLLEVSDSEYLASPNPLLRLERERSFLHEDEAFVGSYLEVILFSLLSFSSWLRDVERSWW